jgi:colanic acid/amylovoran biosynthesis glycosyltransferase
MTSRKVAVFSTNFLEYSQTFIYDEVRAHTRYRVEVFAHRRMNERQFPFSRVRSLAPVRSPRDILASPLYKIFAYSPRYEKAVKGEGFALVHAHFGPGAVYALRVSRISRLPLLITFHGYDVPLLLSSKRFRPEYWRYALCFGMIVRRASRLLAASSELRDLLIEAGAFPEKIRVWRLGVHIPDREPARSPRDNVVLMVGRFVEKKGFEYGIKAFAQAVKSGINAELHIAGCGPLEGSYRRIIRSEGIGDRVRFLGALGHDEVYETMFRSRLLLAPSVTARDGNRESGLLVAKEAGACYLPVIGTCHGGIPEIIDDGITGFLVPERSAGEMSEKLVLLLGDEAEAARMGKAAREKMEKEYNIHDRVADLERIYDEVIGDESPVCQ